MTWSSDQKWGVPRGALLHDAVEDTPLMLEQLALWFNEEVCTIVNGVTHMESNKATI
jgi:(p)ppGpp synthase/HD superfamily hydrolase